MSWSGLAKFFTGFGFAIALILGGGFAAGQYVYTKLTALPPKPIFPNDKPTTPVKAATPAKSQQAVAASQPSPNPSPDQATLAQGYQARVTQSVGLVLRDAPSRNSIRVGGITFNEKVIVLEESPDKEWQRIQVEGSDRQGWVKAGNTERLN